MNLQNHKHYKGKFYWDGETDGAGLYLSANGEKEPLIRFTWTKISKRGFVDYVPSEVVQDMATRKTCKSAIRANCLLDENGLGAVFEIEYPTANHTDRFHVDFVMTDESLKWDGTVAPNVQAQPQIFEF